ncbi:hypothetical protein KK083_03425 [Fulvivirgaceae bacterium PWU4]|uniref:Uncharacterized protein n=1 Tax=Chryseosolibacter histidini TaxID=2782349 RepID=A0AAP2DIN5_9BACT|nr:hypothetical protein [Chryseosolibacter histidini]MBT1695912.1 hypothetical protein [Chryseosolibacter histidini]
MKGYAPKYSMLLPSDPGDLQLPESLLILIEKFENANGAIKDTNREGQLELLKILAQADAVISAGIHAASGAYPSKQRHLPVGPENIDAAKVMAMKAKALRLKWRMKKS